MAIEDRKTRAGGFTSWGMILRYIDDYIKENGFSPTYKEIRDAMNVVSTSTIAHHMSYLLSRGLITRLAGKPRTVRVTDAGREILDR